MTFICCRCLGSDDPQPPAHWMPGIGAICWDHAAEHWTHEFSTTSNPPETT